MNEQIGWQRTSWSLVNLRLFNPYLNVKNNNYRGFNNIKNWSKLPEHIKSYTRKGNPTASKDSDVQTGNYIAQTPS